MVELLGISVRDCRQFLTVSVEESGSVRVTVETSGGAVLGHAHFTYLNPVVEALKHVVYSQEIAPLFLAILEQTIQGCGENSGAAQDPGQLFVCSIFCK